MDKKKNLSDYNPDLMPSAEDMRIGIVVSDWNNEITFALLDGAIKTLTYHGAVEEDIIIKHVPGAFELPFAAKAMYDSYSLDAIITIGCVIQGGTPHFDYVCQGVTQGIMNLNTLIDVPVIFGVLTTDNMEQAKERAGGKHGNKGVEAAVTAIKMAALNNELLEEGIDENNDFDEYFDEEFLN